MEKYFYLVTTKSFSEHRKQNRNNLINPPNFINFERNKNQKNSRTQPRHIALKLPPRKRRYKTTLE